MRRFLPGILLALAAATSPALANAPLNPPAKAPVVFDGHVLVRVAPTEAASLRIESRRGLARMRSTSSILHALSSTYTVRAAAPAVEDALLFPEARDVGLDRWFVFDVDPAAGYEAIAARLRAMPGVEFVYQDRQAIDLLAGVPNDSLFAKNWGHGNTGTFPIADGSGNHTGANVGTVGFDSNIQGGWLAPSGYGTASVIIAILDSGVDPTHPDLPLVAGYDFLNNDADPTDTNGHGTACAGVAAGIANNTKGVAGAAGGCKIMPLQFNDGTAFSHSGFISALAFAVTNGARVASMSFSLNPPSQAMSDALTAADAAGVVLLGAAGNYNNNLLVYPASHPKVIAVGAASPCGGRKRSDSSGPVSPFVSNDSLGVSCDNEYWWGSSWGTAVKDDSAAVDLIGPTMLPTTDIQGAGGFSPTGYEDYFNGTSCATPYVAGVAALILSQHPTWTPAQVRARLVQTAIDVSDAQTPVGWDKYTGYGMVNAGLPDLVPFAFAGWSSPIVPRPTADATFSSVPAPTTLNGDVNSFVSRAVINLGEAHSGTDQGAMLLDGVQVGTLNYSLAPGVGAFSVNNVTVVRGGRHVLGLFLDNNTDIDESNEANNRIAHQWSWVPGSMPTSPTAVVARATPPDRNAGRADVPVAETTYDNLDAVRMVGPALFSSTEFWVMGLHASDDPTDLDLQIHFPSSSATSGITPATQYIGSTLGAGKTDFALVNLQTNPLDQLDAASQLVAGTGGSRFESRLSGSPTTFAGATTSITGSLGSDMMVVVRDLTVAGSGAGPLSLELSATAPVHLAVYDPGFEVSNRAAAARLSVPFGLVEGTTWTAVSGRHAIVLYRDRADGTGTLNYTITVRRPTAELTASTAGGAISAPAGVYKDGVGSTGSPPTVLDGNVNNTRFYYGYTNNGPTAASGFTAREVLDGAEVLTWTPGALNPATSISWISGLRNIRGGRHTMGFINDFGNAIDEFNEIDNDYAVQKVWSPLPLTMEVPVTRPAPPDPTGSWAQIPVGFLRYNNVDGIRTPVLQNVGNDGYWDFFALAPRVATDDVDLAAYYPISGGPSSGFTTALATSTLPAGRVDYIGYDAQAPRALDLGLLKAGAATGNVVVHGSSSLHLASEAGTYGPYTLDPDELVACFDYPALGDPRQIRLINLSGNANLDLHIYTSDESAFLRLPADGLTAEANGDGVDEVLQFTYAGFPAIVVTKRGTSDIAKTATFQIQIGLSTIGTGDDGTLPAAVRLAPVRPNPVRGTASIVFELPRTGTVNLAAYDVAGRHVATLASGTWSAGSHTVSWTPGSQLSSGVYLLKLEAGGVESVRRMVVTK